MDAKEANANYALLNMQGRSYFFGQSAYEAQRYVGKRVEALLAALVGPEVSPFELPMLIHEAVLAAEQSQGQ